jgi:hypothetical protein
VFFETIGSALRNESSSSLPVSLMQYMDV